MSIMDPAKLLARLEKEPTECAWLEFKHNNSDPAEIAQYVSALANSAMLVDRDRAFIVFGLQDKTKKRVGTSVVLANLKKGGENLQNWLARVIEPQLMIELYDFSDQGKRFAIIAIEPSFERPVSAQGIEYIRIGENRKRLKDHPAQERALWLATGRRKFEDAVALPHVSAEGVLELIDIETLFDLMEEEIPRRKMEIIRRLESLAIVRDNLEGRFDILNLGAILLARDISKFPSLKSKSLRIIKYSGTDKRRSISEDKVDQGYAVSFRSCLSIIMKSLPVEERYISGVRRMVPLVPEIAIREVLANALIHQDFTITGSSPVVEIYSNRIEFSNPGSSLIETDRMLNERRSRNEKLASLMRDLGLCEERGGGLDKMMLAIETSHLPAPDFITSLEGMRVVLFGNRPFPKLSKQERLRSCFFHCVLRWISHDHMSNSTLRERFQLEQEDYQAVSAIISEALKSGRILPSDPNQGRRNARYVPYWAG